MPMLIRGARVIDPGKLDQVSDVLIEKGRIAAVQPVGTLDRVGGESEMQVIEAQGLWLTPGLIDMHVHFREPGQEYKETILTGSRAAAAGGFTAVATMPNTDPVNDEPAITALIRQRGVEAGLVRVLPVAAISKGIKGEQLCEFGELKAAGAVGVSDDGRPVMNAQLMRRALEYAAAFGLLVVSHCEDLHLAEGGAMNEGVTATRMGLSGIPNAAESVMVMRDIALAQLTGAPVHIAHVSARQSVTAIRRAKEEGIRVTAETAPHYFTLTDAAVEGYNTHAKMNPPLRSEEDREAVRQGLADGTLDAIATDHAPHSVMEKEVEFDRAANGIIGLETSLPLGLKLVQEGVLTIDTLITRMAAAPARILGMESGVRAGLTADLTLIDPEKVFTVKAVDLNSKSRNTPFDGWQLKGKAVMTILGGKITYQDVGAGSLGRG
ncbi:dihydroorotase [Desulfatitalea tepidiphila]|uniref:dihydroorotase n=1 Tax=Desulfatitalea tepidiphila TaxID=1185843 RepID=UPI0006B54BBA|nr:dihydroorotase [Desulfatitalea tepidiphila]